MTKAGLQVQRFKSLIFMVARSMQQTWCCILLYLLPQGLSIVAATPCRGPPQARGGMALVACRPGRRILP